MKVMNEIKENGVAATEGKQQKKKDNIFRKVKNVFFSKG